MTNETNGALILDEWKMTYKASMHFNDLLMRLRTLGLPAVITIMGVGVAYAANTIALRMLTIQVGIVLSLLSIGLWVIVFWLFRRPYFGKFRSDQKVHDICLWTIEMVFWIIVPTATLIYTILFWVHKCEVLCTFQNIPLSTFILAFGLIMLLSFYILDRFYYYCLLIGAVRRLETIEDALHFEVSKTITEITPRHRSAAVITTLYFLPGIIGYIMLLSLIVFLR